MRAEVRLTAFVVLTGVLVLGVGAAAADPVEDDVITACYKTANGALRVIDLDAGGHCTMSEKQLTWSTGLGLAAPDSVDSAAIRDGAILESDLAAGLSDLLARDTEVSAAVGALRAELGNVSSSDTTADESGDPVSWAKIKDLTTGSGDTLDGVVTGRFIRNGTVATSDLAPQSVTSDKLALTTSQAGDPVARPVPTSFASPTPPTAVVTVTPGAHHTVTVTGHAQLTCTCLTPGDRAAVEWRLYDEENGVLVGQTYRGHLTNANPDLAISVSHLDTAAPGMHRYSLQVSSTTGTSEVTASSTVVSAVDLG